ncbi:MAG TPA: hypothetical protein PLR60_04495 [Syntrophorhabdaceae bacterium]|nr:hypothetical protein [Syntrophorhabdaceae bacterium]
MYTPTHEDGTAGRCVTGCLLPVGFSGPSETHFYAAGARWVHGASLYRRVLCPSSGPNQWWIRL